MWKIEEDIDEGEPTVYYVTNGAVDFATDNLKAAEWLCRLCNWITEGDEAE